MKLDYSAFAGVAGLTGEPVSLAVKADAPWKDIRELLAHAKAHPGQVRVGNSGRGSFTHLVCRLLLEKKKINNALKRPNYEHCFLPWHLGARISTPAYLRCNSGKPQQAPTTRP